MLTRQDLAGFPIRIFGGFCGSELGESALSLQSLRLKHGTSCRDYPTNLQYSSWLKKLFCAFVKKNIAQLGKLLKNGNTVPKIHKKIKKRLKNKPVRFCTNS